MRCLPIFYCARPFKTNIIVADAFTLRCTYVSQPMFLGNIIFPCAPHLQQKQPGTRGSRTELYGSNCTVALTPNANRVFHKSKFSLFGKHNKVGQITGAIMAENSERLLHASNVTVPNYVVTAGMYIILCTSISPYSPGICSLKQ